MPEGEDSSADEEEEDEWETKPPSQKKPKKATEARAVDPLASAALMRQRMEEETKLKAAREMLEKHTQEVATPRPTCDQPSSWGRHRWLSYPLVEF